jgi:hypothetical protein
MDDDYFFVSSLKLKLDVGSEKVIVTSGMASHSLQEPTCLLLRFFSFLSFTNNKREIMMMMIDKERIPSFMFCST